MDQWPGAQILLIGSIRRILAIVQADIEMYGLENAYDLFMTRNDDFFLRTDRSIVDDEEERMALLAFAASLAFVNLLFVTGEVCNDTKH